MYIPELQQHIQVFSRDEAQKLTRIDQQFWNVVSIHGPTELRPPFFAARRVHYACFDDVNETESVANSVCARAEDLKAIFEFAHSLARQPLLIHCQLGISRSTAVALAFIYPRLANDSARVGLAVDILLRLQPRARPNPLVLKLGLACFMQGRQAETAALALLNHPRLTANRTAPR